MWHAFAVCCCLASVAVAYEGVGGPRRLAVAAKARIVPLRLKTEADDDERPRMSMAEDSMEKRMLVKPLEETASKDTSTKSSSTSYSSFAPSAKSSNRKEDGEEKDSSGPSRRAATFGSMSIEDLKGRMVEPAGPMKSWADLPQRPEDLNGINPVTTIVFSLLPAAASFALIQLSNYLSAHFAVQMLTSELYPVQRLAVVVRNLVVGLATLAGGFCGIISVGLLALGVTVAVGVAKGELDPAKDNATGNVK